MTRKSSTLATNTRAANTRPSYFAQYLLAALLGIAVCSAGCGDGGPPTNSNHSEAVDAATNDLFVDDDPIPVPDGTPDELFAFMERIELDQLGNPQDVENNASDQANEQNEAQSLLRVMNARITACDKILNRKEAPESTRTRALRIRLDALRTLAALDPQRRSDEFQRFARKLINGNDPLVRRMAMATQFQSMVNDYISTGNVTSEHVLQELNRLLAEPDAGPEVLGATRDASSWIFNSGDVETAAKAYRLIGTAFQHHSDKVLASEANSLLTQAIYVELTGRIRNVVDEQPGAVNQLLNDLQELLEREDQGPTVLEFSMQTAQFFEFSGRAEDARRAYQMILNRFQDDESRAELVQASVKLANRRLDLVGDTVSLQGIRLNGEPFDWQQYRGKWVLVCFWTTWYDGWLHEVENIRSTLAKHAPEVQVVLINLDDQRNDVERFLQEHPLGWPVVVSPDPSIAGFENENAKRCGVEAVPFTMLIDPDATVVDIHLMGPRLAAALQAIK